MARTARSQLRILTYKRTHTGDPDRSGHFGVNDCMGAVRNRRFDAVIGVGGIGAEPRRWGVAGKLTWIGIGPRRSAGRDGRRGDVVSFDRFMLFDADGPDFRSIAPNLARRIFDGRVRALLDGYSHAEFREALAILRLIQEVSAANSKDSVVERLEGACGKRRPRLKNCRRRGVSCTAKNCD